MCVAATYLIRLHCISASAVAGRTIVAMNGQDLAVGEAAARELMCRLGDCSREIDRLASIVRAVPRNGAAERVGQECALARPRRRGYAFTSARGTLPHRPGWSI